MWDILLILRGSLLLIELARDNSEVILLSVIIELCSCNSPMRKELLTQRVLLI